MKFKQKSNTRITAVAIYALSFGLVVTIIYHLYLHNRIIPGVVLGGVDVGGLTYEKALEKTKNTETQKDKTVKLTTSTGKTYTIDTNKFELNYDWDLGIDRAFEVGRTGNILIDTRDKMAGIIKKLVIPAKYTYNKDSLGGFVAQIRSEINIPSVSAGLSLNSENKLEITPEIYGKSLDEQEIYDTVRLCLDNLDFSEKNLLVEDDNPQYTKRDLESVINNAQSMINKPIDLISKDYKRSLTSEELTNLIKLTRTSDKLEIGIDKTKFENIYNTLANELNKLPKGNVTSSPEGRVLEFQITQTGLEIDKDELYSKFKQAFYGNNKTVEIPMKEIKTSKNGSEYGIFALLGKGTSNFTGSYQGRITNLSLAAERTNGVLVAPQTEYSFNKAVGEISGRTGYALAYIIAQGRTVLGEGGGVCQTSTTLFRAVLNSGLPITSRHPHAYRVSYYELESQVGFDASVFQPSLDFKFINNTPGYILIQSSIDLSKNILTFEIYGTPDGRKVEISDVKLYNVYAAPTPLYQDDPTLQKGVVKQIEYSAPGGTAEFTRRVTKGDELLFEDTFRSVYQPWRAIFLVGTKT